MTDREDQREAERENGEVAEGEGDSVDIEAAETGEANEEKPEKEGYITREYRKALYQYSFIGIEFGVALAIGFLVGHWLDGKLGTDPWLMLACVLFSLVVAFRDLYLLVRRMEKKMKGGES